MPRLSNTRIIAFSAEKIHRAVMDIESYPRILSFVQSVKILHQEAGLMNVRVFVGLPMLNFSYDCRIESKEPDYVKVEMISGPFKKLTALWKFESVDGTHCKVEYMLDSEFKNPLMELTAGAIFASQINQSITAFEEVLKRS